MINYLSYYPHQVSDYAMICRRVMVIISFITNAPNRKEVGLLYSFEATQLTIDQKLSRVDNRFDSYHGNSDASSQNFLFAALGLFYVITGQYD